MLILMKKIKLIFFTILYLSLVNCLGDGTKDFNDYAFNTIIKDPNEFYIDYNFGIDGKLYANKTYDFIYYPKNNAEYKFLEPESQTEGVFPIPWRQVSLPFKIIKKINSDTLIVIKNNRIFIFKRERNRKY